MDLACIINIRFLVPIHWICPSNISLKRSTHWRISRAPGLLWIYLTQCWSVPHLSAWNLSTGNTATILTSCSETYPIMLLPSKSNPSFVLNSERSCMPNLASFQGKILPIILHRDFLYRSLAQHSNPPAQHFPMCAQSV